MRKIIQEIVDKGNELLGNLTEDNIERFVDETDERLSTICTWLAENHPTKRRRK